MHFLSYQCPNCIPHSVISVAVSSGTQIQQIYKDQPSRRRHQSPIDTIPHTPNILSNSRVWHQRVSRICCWGLISGALERRKCSFSVITPRYALTQYGRLGFKLLVLYRNIWNHICSNKWFSSKGVINVRLKYLIPYNWANEWFLLNGIINVRLEYFIPYNWANEWFLSNGIINVRLETSYLITEQTNDFY